MKTSTRTDPWTAQGVADAALSTLTSSRETPVPDRTLGETEIRCGRCQSFVLALVDFMGSVTLRIYCKRCGHKWGQVVRRPQKADA
jgi:hypothetical protein